MQSTAAHNNSDGIRAISGRRPVAVSTVDLFDSQNDDSKTAQRIAIQKKQNEIKGGIAETGDLPLFSKQVDLFD